VRLRWVYTDGASVVPREGTPVNNRALNYDHDTRLAVGQLPLVESDFRQDARWKLPAGLPNGHVCERQWLATGEPWPNDLPHSRWSESGWPDCCGVMVEGTRGGLAFGSLPVRMRGGLQLGGEAGEHFAPAGAVSGGLKLGGEAGEHFAPAGAVSGGLAFGGEAGEHFAPAGAVSGGLKLGGEAGEHFAPAGAVSGGLKLGGEAGDHFAPAGAVSGGLQLGGAVLDRFTVPVPTHGGFGLKPLVDAVFTPVVPPES